jgi:hypothetical protein
MKTRKEVNKISFTELEKGDRFLVETLLGQTVQMFDITVTGKRKTGLLVKVKKILGEKIEEFTARMPGGFTMHGKRLTDYLKVESQEEKNCLFFENIKDPKTDEKICSTMRTTPILKITLIETVKQ